MQVHPHEVLGLHLEGPYTNVLRKGIHPADQIRLPTTEMIDYLCEHAPWIAKVTLAPEQNNPQQYAERTADLKAALSRAEADIAGIKREISRLPQAAN